MGDKNPKSKEKNMKQKESVKVKEQQKVQAQKDAKAIPGKPKK